MLKSTQIIEGNLRKFLDFTRGDNVVDSYSLITQNNDEVVPVNCITRSDRNLIYINDKIQSDNNTHVLIPLKYASINDVSPEQLTKQTKLERINELISKDNLDQDSIFEIAGLYYSIKLWEKAEKYYRMYVDMEKDTHYGNIHMSLYRIAYISYYCLDKPWEETCHSLFVNAYSYDKNKEELCNILIKIESLYIMGKHYVEVKKYSIGILYLRQAFDMLISQSDDYYNVYHSLPYFIATHAHLIGMGDDIGYDACKRYLEYKSEDSKILKLYNMYKLNIEYRDYVTTKEAMPGRATACILLPSNLDTNIENFITGLLTKFPNGCNIFIFQDKDNNNNDTKQKTYSNVTYSSISDYVQFIKKYKVSICVISKYIEYIPVSFIASNNVYYLISEHTANELSDLIAVNNSMLKKLFYFDETFKNKLDTYSELQNISLLTQ
jgi:hypothetical protein